MENKLNMQDLVFIFNNLSKRAESAIDKTIFSIEIIKSFGMPLSTEVESYIENIKLFKTEIINKTKFVNLFATKFPNYTLEGLDLNYYNKNVQYIEENTDTFECEADRLEQRIQPNLYQTKQKYKS